MLHSIYLNACIGKKLLIRRANIELKMKTEPCERIMPKEDFDITEYCIAEEIA